MGLAVAQPDPSPVDLDALIALAGLLAITLSLGLTVTLLVAQHTAESHARALYAEFRRERAWLFVLGWLALGVAAIVAASLVAPSKSTAWAALALAVALGLLAATLFPRLLDSLDRTQLSNRVTDRIVSRIRTLARRTDALRRLDVLAPEAKRGIDIAGSLVNEGVEKNDVEVVRAGFGAIRRILLEYLRGIPASIGMDDAVVHHSFQHLEVAMGACVQRSPVLLLPVALTEATALGVEATRVPNHLSDYEPTSIRLNSLFVDVVASTLRVDASAAAAIATAGIGDAGVALVQAARPTGLSDHIRRLRSIALAGLAAERDHIVGQATHELARIALVLTESDPNHSMPASLYDDACEVIVETIDAFIARTTLAAALMRDVAMTPITGPLASPNLAAVALAGLAVDSAGRARGSRDFARGADRLVYALCRLAGYETSVVMTPSYAIDTAYSAVVGALALEPTDAVADHAPRWWGAIWGFLVARSDPDRPHDQVQLAASLLLIASYEAESDREPVASKMRTALDEALTSMSSVREPRIRRRLVRAWVPAVLAALGSGDEALAGRIVRSLRRDLLDLQRTLEGRLAQAGAHCGLQPPVFGTPFRVLPAAHRQPDAIARLEALVQPVRSRSNRRTRSRAATKPLTASGPDSRADGSGPPRTAGSI